MKTNTSARANHFLPALALLCCSFLSTPVVMAQPVAAPEHATASYGEPHRPRFHFSPPTSWMNDPNGLVYYDGEYHLFYQYYPDDTVWGPMHWGHAVSSDLVHWQQLPIALYPDEHGYIFSGSAVVDWRNRSGFGRDGQPPLVAIFTYHDPVRGKAGTNDHESQGIAWSNDRGRTWTKYEGNPVLPNPGNHKDFRDPKVFWHADSGRWVMALSATDHVEFWASPDLKQWAKLSEFGHGLGAHGGVWECPDLVRMAVQGSEESRWVLILNLNPGGPQGGSGTQYFVGDFDGQEFTLDPSFRRTLDAEGAVWLDSGRDDYAGVTWSDVPRRDGRTLFIGWMGNWDYAQQVPTDPWRSAMTLPRELTLHRSGNGYRVWSAPVAELRGLRSASWHLEDSAVAADASLPLALPFPAAVSEVILEFRLPAGADCSLGLELGNDQGERYRVGFDRARNAYFSDRRAAGEATFSDSFAGVHFAPRLLDSERLRLHIYFDVASAELFADGGSVVMTDTFFPSRPFERAALFSERCDARVSRVEVYPLTSIWQ